MRKCCSSACLQCYQALFPFLLSSACWLESALCRCALSPTGGAGAGGLGSEAQRAAQAARVESLALNLKVILRRYVEGDEEGFQVRQLGGAPPGPAGR